MSLTFRLVLCASAIALMSATAFAQQANTSHVINDQLQWGDVFATMNVVAPNGRGDVSSSALAAGNAASAANLTGGLDVRSTQTMSGAAFATATIEADDTRSAAVAVASAQGSSLEAQTVNGDLVLDGAQTVDGGDAVATARANIGNADLFSVAANAASNNIALDADTGALTARIQQDAQNSVTAIADADAGGSGQSVVGASAAANAIQTTSTTSTVSADYRQSATGRDVYASADVYQPTAGDVTVASSAAGNSANIANQWGYASIRGRQDNAAAIKSETRATLTKWDGSAVASSYAVGNATLATNIGSDLAVDVTQMNTGGVDAFTKVDGGSSAGVSGDAIVNATAIGNAFTGYVCSQCGDANISGSVSQTNGGNVTATGAVITNSAGSVIGTASAIGNASTFITSTSRP